MKRYIAYIKPVRFRAIDMEDAIEHVNQYLNDWNHECDFVEEIKENGQEPE